MWPWTHLAFGYLSHSLATRFSLRRPPTDGPVLVALFASLLPDLVDKPLAWTFEVVATGYGPAHSVLVGAPLIFLISMGLLWHAAWREHGLALVTGYSSHLVGDLLFQFFDDGEFVGAVILWPVAAAESESSAGALERVMYFLVHYVDAVLDGEATGYALLTLAILIGVTVLWLLDGKPGINWLFDTSSHGEK